MTSAIPYHYGSPAAGEHFTDRADELKLLVERMAGGINVIVHAPRRYGKTSLLRRAEETARRRRVGVGYANLLRCSTRREVSQAVVSAVFAGPLRRSAVAGRIGELVGRLRVRPRVDFGADGTLSLGFDPSLAEQDWWGALEDACRLMAEESARHPVALVLDEFQQIATVDPALAGVFKAILDETPTVSYVLAGSHVHMMERLTTEPGAPLLNMGELLRLGAIPEAAMVRYLVARAAGVERTMDEATAGLICRLGGPVPNDIQRLAQAAFDVAGAEIGPAEVELGLDVAVGRQSETFAERYERLGGVAQRMLRLMAASPVSQPYSRAVLVAVEVANANAVRKALDVLAAAELVREERGSWVVADPFMRRWLAAGAD